MRIRWREYGIEGALLGLFMMAACGFASLLEHPDSPAHRVLPDAAVRRLLMGCAMGLTAVALIRSPWGRESGAHMNPALTLAYFRLRKIGGLDLLGYVAGQFAGGVAGVGLAGALLGAPAAHPAVQFAVTVPGPGGTSPAFTAELAMSFVLMTVVLVTSNARRLAAHTPLLCGLLIAACIAFEAPVSGMSMNPARSFASAVAARHWTALWIYFTAPPIGMLAAAEAYVRIRGAHRVLCAKLDHRTARRCIFRCDAGALGNADPA